MSLSRTVRAALAFTLFSLWLVILFSGLAVHGGAVHLLLVGALALFPWRNARPAGSAGVERRGP